MTTIIISFETWEGRSSFVAFTCLKHLYVYLLGSLFVCLFVCLFVHGLPGMCSPCMQVEEGPRWWCCHRTEVAAPDDYIFRTPWKISFDFLVFFCQGRSLHPLLSILSNVFLLQMFLQEGFFPAQIFTKPAVTVLCRLFVWPFCLFICLFDIWSFVCDKKRPAGGGAVRRLQPGQDRHPSSSQSHPQPHLLFIRLIVQGAAAMSKLTPVGFGDRQDDHMAATQLRLKWSRGYLTRFLPSQNVCYVIMFTWQDVPRQSRICWTQWESSTLRQLTSAPPWYFKSSNRSNIQLKDLTAPSASEPEPDKDDKGDKNKAVHEDESKRLGRQCVWLWCSWKYEKENEKKKKLSPVDVGGLTLARRSCNEGIPTRDSSSRFSSSRSYWKFRFLINIAWSLSSVSASYHNK